MLTVGKSATGMSDFPKRYNVLRSAAGFVKRASNSPVFSVDIVQICSSRGSTRVVF